MPLQEHLSPRFNFTGFLPVIFSSGFLLFQLLVAGPAVLTFLVVLAVEAGVVHSWQPALRHLTDGWQSSRWFRPKTFLSSFFLATLLFKDGLVWYRQTMNVCCWVAALFNVGLDTLLELVSSRTSSFLGWFGII